MLHSVLGLCVLLAACPCAVYHVAQGHPGASDDNPGTADAPWATISKAAATLEAGDRVIVHAGVYREWVEPRNSGRPGAPIVYEAAEGEEVIVTGADLITDWRPVGSAWEAQRGSTAQDAKAAAKPPSPKPAAQAPQPAAAQGDVAPAQAPAQDRRPIYCTAWPHKFIINHVDGKPIYHHPADDKHLRSGRAEQIIVDAQVWDYPQLVLSLDDMRPGTFFPDVDAGLLYIWLPDGSDPSTHRIEASTRPMIFGTNPWRRKEGFDYVHVRGFIFRYAATFAQRPAVWLLGRNNLIEDCLIEWMSGGGVGVGPEGAVLRRCIIRNCGHTGGCAAGQNFLNEDCVWENNCRKPISRGWDAGGVKICRAHHGIFQRCVFRNNGGPGLWLDIDDNNVLIRDCVFQDNEGHGLFVEISRNIYIINNVFLRNGLRAEHPNWSTAGLTLAESRNCVVCNNLLVGNRDGIALREQGPRYLDTPDLGLCAFQNVGHVIVGNVSAFNVGYQLALWYDTAFFGRHPADTQKYNTEEEFEAAVKRENPDRWFDPLQQGLVIDRNLYWPGTPEEVAQAAWPVGSDAAPTSPPSPKLFLYGVPWRVRHKEFADLTAFTNATGFEAHGQVADPGLQLVEGGQWTLSRDGLAFRINVGPRYAIPQVKTFSRSP